MNNEKIKIQETALLVIDIINSCSHPDCEIKKWDVSFKKIRKMIPKLKNFIKKYKEGGGKIIYVNCTPWDKKHLAKNIIELYDNNPLSRYYSNDKTGFSEQFFEVSPEKDDFIITKNNYDAFTNPKIQSILKTNNINYVIIAGIFGDGCVNSTINGGFSKGYNFIILNDLIETTDVKIRQNIQKLLKQYTWPIMFGKTINSTKFFDYISK